MTFEGNKPLICLINHDNWVGADLKLRELTIPAKLGGPFRRSVTTRNLCRNMTSIGCFGPSPSFGTQTDPSSLVVEQAVGDPQPHSHEPLPAPQVAVQSSAHPTGSAGRPKKTQSSSVYRRLTECNEILNRPYCVRINLTCAFTTVQE